MIRRGICSLPDPHPTFKSLGSETSAATDTRLMIPAWLIPAPKSECPIARQMVARAAATVSIRKIAKRIISERLARRSGNNDHDHDYWTRARAARRCAADGCGGVVYEPTGR